MSFRVAVRCQAKVCLLVPCSQWRPQAAAWRSIKGHENSYKISPEVSPLMFIQLKNFLNCKIFLCAQYPLKHSLATTLSPLNVVQRERQLMDTFTFNLFSRTPSSFLLRGFFSSCQHPLVFFLVSLLHFPAHKAKTISSVKSVCVRTSLLKKPSCVFLSKVNLCASAENLCSSPLS